MKTKRKLKLSDIAIIIALITLWLILLGVWVLVFVDIWYWIIFTIPWTLLGVALTLTAVEELRD